MNKLVKKIISSKIFWGIILSFEVYFLLFLENPKHLFIFDISELARNNKLILFSLNLFLTTFLCIIIGFSSRPFSYRKLFYCSSTGITSGLLVTVFTILFLGKSSSFYPSPVPLLIFLPIIFVAIIIGLIDKSLFKAIIGIIAGVIFGIFGSISVAVGLFLTYGLGGQIIDSRIGELPVYMASILAGILIVIGVGIGDYFIKNRHRVRI